MSDPRVVAANMFDRGAVSIKPNANAPTSFPLPLNLLTLIISYLDQSADLSKVCRACRIFYYIALPQLYNNVCLHSYDHIRYNQFNGHPEGCGMASPFSTGLDGLVTRDIVGYVKRFEVCGEWKDYGSEEEARIARIPDGSMMLNTLVRIAVERMVSLEDFSWNLTTKMLSTVWQALANKGSLKSLCIKFPNKRHPRPKILVPPIPSLQSLKITDIDPLCYGDDISQLLHGSRKLQDLKMHWSPRMRAQAEPSTQPAAYFGRFRSEDYQIPLKSIAVQNMCFYGGNSDTCAIDMHTLEELTFLNSTGGLGDDGSTIFMDVDWRKPTHSIMPRLKMLCIDKVSRAQCDFLGNLEGLERLYLRGPSMKTTQIHTPPISSTSSPSCGVSNMSNPSNYPSSSIQALKTPYLNAITRAHGPTLRHLLLIPQWRLTADDVSLVIRSCPNLEQLAIGSELEDFKHLRLLIPFLPKLSVVRFFGDEDQGGELTAKMRELDSQGLQVKHIGEEFMNSQWSRLKYLELGGSDLIFEIGGKYRVEDIGEQESQDGQEERKEVWRRRVRKRTPEEVREIDIWRMESGDI